MGNYVIGVGNYVIVSPLQLGNYKIADTPDPLDANEILSVALHG
jgi:hypothetical protein